MGSSDDQESDYLSESEDEEQTRKTAMNMKILMRNLTPAQQAIRRKYKREKAKEWRDRKKGGDEEEYQEYLEDARERNKRNYDPQKMKEKRKKEYVPAADLDSDALAERRRKRNIKANKYFKKMDPAKKEKHRKKVNEYVRKTYDPIKKRELTKRYYDPVKERERNKQRHGGPNYLKYLAQTREYRSRPHVIAKRRAYAQRRKEKFDQDNDAQQKREFYQKKREALAILWDNPPVHVPDYPTGEPDVQFPDWTFCPFCNNWCPTSQFRKHLRMHYRSSDLMIRDVTRVIIRSTELRTRLSLLGWNFDRATLLTATRVHEVVRHQRANLVKKANKFGATSGTGYTNNDMLRGQQLEERTILLFLFLMNLDQAQLHYLSGLTRHQRIRFLAATADALYSHYMCIEAKNTRKTFREIIQERSILIPSRDGSGGSFLNGTPPGVNRNIIYTLNPAHTYRTQFIVQIVCTARQEGYFVIMSQQDSTPYVRKENRSAWNAWFNSVPTSVHLWTIKMDLAEARQIFRHEMLPQLMNYYYTHMAVESLGAIRPDEDDYDDLIETECFQPYVILYQPQNIQPWDGLSNMTIRQYLNGTPNPARRSSRVARTSNVLSGVEEEGRGAQTTRKSPRLSQQNEIMLEPIKEESTESFAYDDNSSVVVLDWNDNYDEDLDVCTGKPEIDYIYDPALFESSGDDTTSGEEDAVIMFPKKKALPRKKGNTKKQTSKNKRSAKQLSYSSDSNDDMAKATKNSIDDQKEPSPELDYSKPDRVDRNPQPAPYKKNINRNRPPLAQIDEPAASTSTGLSPSTRDINISEESTSENSAPNSSETSQIDEVTGPPPTRPPRRRKGNTGLSQSILDITISGESSGGNSILSSIVENAKNNTEQKQASTPPLQQSPVVAAVQAMPKPVNPHPPVPAFLLSDASQRHNRAEGRQPERKRRRANLVQTRNVSSSEDEEEENANCYSPNNSDSDHYGPGSNPAGENFDNANYQLVQKFEAVTITPTANASPVNILLETDRPNATTFPQNVQKKANADSYGVASSLEDYERGDAHVRNVDEMITLNSEQLAGLTLGSTERSKSLQAEERAKEGIFQPNKDTQFQTCATSSENPTARALSGFGAVEFVNEPPSQKPSPITQLAVNRINHGESGQVGSVSGRGQFQTATKVPPKAEKAIEGPNEPIPQATQPVISSTSPPHNRRFGLDTAIVHPICSGEKFIYCTHKLGTSINTIRSTAISKEGESASMQNAKTQPIAEKTATLNKIKNLFSFSNAAKRAQKEEKRTMLLQKEIKYRKARQEGERQREVELGGKFPLGCIEDSRKQHGKKDELESRKLSTYETSETWKRSEAKKPKSYQPPKRQEAQAVGFGYLASSSSFTVPKPQCTHDTSRKTMYPSVSSSIQSGRAGSIAPPQKDTNKYLSLKR